MDAAPVTLSDRDRELLRSHYDFYHDLDSGKRTPDTPAQRHFVAVCRGEVAPETEHEFAYWRFKQAVAAAGLVSHATTEAETVEVPSVPVRPCAGCARPIPPERLATLPEAMRCVACQRQEEVAAEQGPVSELGCPLCSLRGLRSRLVWRTARDPAAFAGYFLGCGMYPECKYVDRS